MPLDKRNIKERAIKEKHFQAYLNRRHIFKNLVMNIVNEKRVKHFKKPEYLVVRFLDLIRTIKFLPQK